jgi:protein TonB
LSQQGATGTDQAQAAAAQQRLALRAQWGARIHSRVQRNLRYPRGTARSGTAKLALKVAPNGSLQELSLLRSSGDVLLDKAAISAVQRAGRFDRAPDGLTDVSYAFSLSLTFNR